MARWRLITAHYLKVPGTVWEENSTDRETGRQKRIAHPVPLHLDPKDPTCWTHKPSSGHVSLGGNSWDEGAIIVAWKGKTDDRRDIIFEGDPTYPTEMEPIDDEAKRISEELWPNFTNPMDEAYTALSPTEQMLVDLQAKMSEAMTSFGAARSSVADPAIGELKEVLKQLTVISAQNSQLLQQLASPNRRV